MKATKVKLRKREYANGTVTLYLDFYPPIRDPRTMKPTRREYLGMSIIKDPRTPAERRINDQKLKQAEAIRAQRELSIINEQYGFLDKTKYKMDVIEYFQDIVLGKDQKWGIVLEHFKKFSHGTCTFSELTIEFCNAFRDYLSTANRLNSATLKISPNSAASYWSTFRAFLAIAVKEGYISENINKNTSDDIFGYDTICQDKMPLAGTHIKINTDTYLLYNNGKYEHTKEWEKKLGKNYHFPIKLRFDFRNCPSLNTEATITELIQQIFQLSRLDWRTTDIQNLPITILYPSLVAEFLPYFSNETLPNKAFSTKALWFL